MSSRVCQKLAEFAESVCIVANVYDDEKVVFETEGMSKYEIDSIKAAVKEIMETKLRKREYTFEERKKMCVVYLASAEKIEKRKKFVEVLTSQPKLIDSLLEFAVFKANGHWCDDCPEDEQCEDCYSGDTEHGMDDDIGEVLRMIYEKVYDQKARFVQEDDGEESE